MKIGILVTIGNGFGKKGFYQSQEIGLGKELVSNGHTVIVFKGVPDGDSFKKERVKDAFWIYYIPMKHIGIHGYISLKYLEVEEKLDCMLCFSDTQIFIKHIYNFCEKNKIVFIPYVGISHSSSKSFKAKFLNFLFEKRTLPIYKKSVVLAKTEGVKEELESLGVKNCRLVPVGLNRSVLKLDFKEYDRIKLRKEFGFNEEDIIINFIGRLQSEKRPLDCIEIFNKLVQKSDKTYKLLMVGSGYEKENILKLIEKYNLTEKVVLFDKIPYNDMWKIHYISDFFVALCSREIFGMALIEAVVYLSSVAAIKADGPNSILRNLEGHKLCNDLEEVFQWISGDKPNETVLEKDSEYVLDKFSWNICVKEIEDIVQGR